LRLWKAAGVDIATARPAGYKECGRGMGPAPNMASSLDGHVLIDRGTWPPFKNRGGLVIPVEGDTSQFNSYGVMVVDPARFPNVKGPGTAVCRLGGVGRRAGRHRQLQDRRRAALLPQRRTVGRGRAPTCAAPIRR
jgi:hypothetical protein